MFFNKEVLTKEGLLSESFLYVVPEYLYQFLIDIKKTKSDKPIKILVVDDLPDEIGGYTLVGQNFNFAFLNTKYLKANRNWWFLVTKPVICLFKM